jgi:malate synthase
MNTKTAEIELTAPNLDPEILSDEALVFVARLVREFRATRLELLAARTERQKALDAGGSLDFEPATASVRESDWSVVPPAHDLTDRRVEITGPVDAKMVINALNSGANVFMADFEDACTPTWENVVSGQRNLLEAQKRTLTLETDAKRYELGEDLATLMVRPRGWHLIEKHVHVDGEPVPASLFDFGLYLFHGGQVAIERGSGPYFYLPKLEHHLEARLWNDVFTRAQELLGLPIGTIRATVLIETITAAFQMDEILYELREHSAGLNAGRWDYIFSVIKKFRNRREFVLPDRSAVTMTTPFMHAYTELQIATCHRRGAHALGGMAAFIPNRADPEVTEAAFVKVGEDKRREAEAGCDGTWVAHPGLVDVARAEFDEVLGDHPNQLDNLRQVSIGPDDLLNVEIPGAAVTEAGLRTNINVGIRYLDAWLAGTGAAGIDNLMEDVATAEISRSQIWQWVNHGVVTSELGEVTADLVRRLTEEEVAGLDVSREAVDVFLDVALNPDFTEFLTLVAYDHID